MSGLDSKWVKLTPNGTNLGLCKISFSTFWLGESENCLKKSQICPICHQTGRMGRAKWDMSITEELWLLAGSCLLLLLERAEPPKRLPHKSRAAYTSLDIISPTIHNRLAIFLHNHPQNQLTTCATPLTPHWTSILNDVILVQNEKYRTERQNVLCIYLKDEFIFVSVNA